VLDLLIWAAQCNFENLLGISTANDYTSCSGVFVRRRHFPRQRLLQTIQSTSIVHEID